MSNSKPGSDGISRPKNSLAALAEAANGGTNASEPVAWTLPSGEQLLHYALKGGFLAPSILTPAKTAPAKGGEGKR